MGIYTLSSYNHKGYRLRMVNFVLGGKVCIVLHVHVYVLLHNNLQESKVSSVCTTDIIL